MTTARHPNRTGLRATTATTGTGTEAEAEVEAEVEAAQAAGGTSVLACRCPARTVSGTLWAYDSRLGWHDPAEHSTWTPPRQPPHAPLPLALRDWTGPTPLAAADRRHALAPAGHGLVVCTTCGLCFDAGACTRSGRPLPTCQPRTGGAVSVPGPTLLSNAEEDA